jgi:N6-L-threonylcarbamoyladenine synthase
MALTGDAGRFDFPRPLAGRADAHFSFAGLKTAVRRRAVELVPLSDKDISDLCAAFQAAAMDAVADRVGRAMEIFEDRMGTSVQRRLVVAGGVAANRELRKRLDRLVTGRGYSLHVPPASLCTDNGAMIAWAGAERLAARPRWPLDQNAPAAIGAGVKA